MGVTLCVCVCVCVRVCVCVCQGHLGDGVRANKTKLAKVVIMITGC